VKSVGKPDARNRPVRFDERGKGNGPVAIATETAPFLDSTQEETLFDEEENH
jgi:hypothetical protein